MLVSVNNMATINKKVVQYIHCRAQNCSDKAKENTLTLGKVGLEPQLKISAHFRYLP